jgi:hypothetical protein
MYAAPLPLIWSKIAQRGYESVKHVPSAAELPKRKLDGLAEAEER